MTMQHIYLSYQWQPHEQDAVRNRHSPLRNPLMDLLQALRSEGSIGSAAKSLSLSYRHVWGELKRWEQLMGEPLIVWEKGQAARLSGFADKLLWAERQAQARLSPQISALQAELEKTLALAFDPTQQVLPIYASHDDALVHLREAAAAQSLHLDLRFCGSVDAIRALNEGRCQVAGFHMPWQPVAQSLLARTCKPLLKPGRHKLMGFAKRQQGLLIAPGNPLGLYSLRDLFKPQVRFVNRSAGTGTRLLLDQSLAELGLSAVNLQGYDHEENAHAAVAACIASGQADAGLGIASAARLQGLDFVPLFEEHYWLVCLASALDSQPVLQLRKLLQTQSWQQQLGAIPGYSLTTDAGQVQSLRSMLPWWHFRSVREKIQG